jgi:hypothetical protein
LESTCLHGDQKPETRHCHAWCDLVKFVFFSYLCRWWVCLATTPLTATPWIRIRVSCSGCCIVWPCTRNVYSYSYMAGSFSYTCHRYFFRDSNILLVCVHNTKKICDAHYRVNRMIRTLMEFHLLLQVYGNHSVEDAVLGSLEHLNCRF